MVEAAQVLESDENSKRSETALTDSKAQIIADMEAAEAMADAPAIEINEEADVTLVQDNKVSAPDPSITIEPAVPMTTVEVGSDQASAAEETTGSSAFRAPAWGAGGPVRSLSSSVSPRRRSDY